MTKRVAAISIEELRKDVEDGGGVPQLDLENLLQSCHHMPDLVKEKILYEWIKKHLMCFLTLDAVRSLLYFFSLHVCHRLILSIYYRCKRYPDSYQKLIKKS